MSGLLYIGLLDTNGHDKYKKKQFDVFVPLIKARCMPCGLKYSYAGKHIEELRSALEKQHRCNPQPAYQEPLEFSSGLAIIFHGQYTTAYPGHPA